MNPQQVFPHAWWKRYVVAIALVVFAAALRVWPLQSLESNLAWLTFYPAVMVVAIYGGLAAGLLATVLACLTVTFLWSILVAEPFINNLADWLGMVVFILTGSMISGIAEAMRRAQSRAINAQIQTEAANIKLKENVIALMQYKVIIESSDDAIISKTLEGFVTSWNPGAERMFGYTPNEIIGHSINILVPKDIQREELEFLNRIRMGETIKHYETVRQCKNGKQIDISVTLSPIHDVNGNIVSVSKVAHDITNRRRADELLRKSEARYRALFENMLNGFAYCRVLFENGRPIDLIYINVNNAFTTLTGLKDVVGKKISEIVPGLRESNPEIIETYGRVVLSGVPEQFETYVVTLKLWLSITVYSPEKEHFVAIFENITERKLAISKVKQAENELRIAAAAFDTHDAIMMTDDKAFIIKVNRAFTAITGYSPEEVMGRNPRFMKSGRHDKAFYVEMFHKLERDGKWEGEIWDKRKDGEIYPRWMTITAIKDEQQKLIQYVSIFSDITERKKNEELINRMAFYDPLTQLPNRRMLNDRLGQAMVSNKRHGIYGAVMFMDLDKFKPLNDTHGHVVGDLLLLEVGRRISSCIRESDTVARFGGDEFVVMLGELNADEATSRNEASNVAEKIRISLAETYFLKSQEGNNTESCVEHNCSSSIGVALFNGHEESQEAIFKQADIAMYRAKEAGRNLVCFDEAGI